ncbi:Serine/Threonine kinase domain protein (macronuclear) [Tetrahymena thermophila SB210]|uniref:Serine/Threonine kinase domain protein n=1 Tax=Tetrahymena thermophila (strain SB210) TaxID=312017 RepID=I7LWJ4_TETTS|nr:Serine/Threonine kinase domain protein [Tetrahymena thermophila SB210]EAS02000.2 Serine/Threonine kinase domain protein [Tetrahymena thermophila SB210]|eukprot:XP_001022245.2 Serine/Threonine kinase domain protein [Tetrahymena thermophila SB210]
MNKDVIQSPNSMQSQQMQSSLTDSIETRSSKSISDTSNKNYSFDYSGCQMHCQLYIKGLMTKKKVNMYFHQNQIILSNEAYAKKPKRIIQLGFYDIVKWVVQKSDTQLTYTGMILTIRKEKEDKTFEKIEDFEFIGDSIILEQVKDYLRRYIFQTRIQDEYIIQAQIGKGNYARVFSARHRQTGSKIALKCFEKEKLRKTENGYKSLEKEIKIMQTVGSHPNLLEFIGSYEGENTYYVAMGLIEGNSLYNEIKKRKDEKFPIQKIKSFIQQIISGVLHFQKYGVMHRDLKPENIMFKRKENLDELVIVDFGLAEFENEPQYLFSKCGTPGYVAPEVANYKEELQNRYTTKCDMFSVGVILHTLLYHSSVFYGKKFNDVLLKNKECKIDFNSKLYENTSERTMNFMKGLLEKDPIKRLSAQQALNHEFFYDIDEDETQQIRKKAGSWNISAPKLEQDEIVVNVQQTEQQSPGLNNNNNKQAGSLRKRACTSQIQQQLKNNLLNIPSLGSGQTQNNEAAINSFNNALSQEQISTSFHHNIYNMFQSNMTNSVAKGNNQQSDGKSNIMESAKLSIELGSSPYMQPMNPEMVSSSDQKKQIQLNKVQEEEEDTESPNIRKKMKLVPKDFKIGILQHLEKQQSDTIVEVEKELDSILKLSKLNSQQNKNQKESDIKVSEQNESQEIDRSLDLDEQDKKQHLEKLNLDLPNNQHQEIQEIK